MLVSGVNLRVFYACFCGFSVEFGGFPQTFTFSVIYIQGSAKGVCKCRQRVGAVRTKSVAARPTETGGLSLREQ